MTKYDNILDTKANARWRRLLSGLILGSGAPIGWLLLQLIQGAQPSTELVSHWQLYVYLTVGSLTAFGVFGYALGRQEDYLRSLSQRLSVASITDELTGLRNSRYFWSRLSEEFAMTKRKDYSLSLVIFDLDDFKKINDTWGHKKGDQVLERVGDLLKSEVRRYDLAARIGGEEFALLLPGTDLETASYIGERLRAKFSTLQFSTGESGSPFYVTASAGVATTADSVETSRQLFERADQALYEAKSSGRDRLESYTGSSRAKRSRQPARY